MGVKLNSVVDILAGISFLFSAISGVILKFFLQRGSGQLGNLIFGLTRESWLGIHDVSSLSLIFLILIHIALHYKWVLSIPKFWKSTNI